MELQLEINQLMLDLGEDYMRHNIVMLNMPDINLCEKRAETIEMPDGSQRQSCFGCITQGIGTRDRMSLDEIKTTIDYFADNHGTKIIAIPGRGDPLHPSVRDYTFEKIRHAKSRRIVSYIFNASNNLDAYTCEFLSEHGVNVMMSLFGNPFIDADFFSGKSYPTSQGRLQNQGVVAENFRRLIRAYKHSSNQPTEGISRLGMNYPLSEADLEDQTKLKELKAAANNDGLFFLSNTNFQAHQNPEIRKALRKLAIQYTNFNIEHSTGVYGQCQMGSGSSATVDYDGKLFRCPYMRGIGDGSFLQLPEEERRFVLDSYQQDRKYICVMRGTIKE